MKSVIGGRTPGEVAVLRDSPADHAHHHALMFALSFEGVTFWEEKADAGRQVLRQLKRERDRLSQVLDWTTPEGEVVLHEERSIRLHETHAPVATLLTWRGRLQAPAGRASVTLTGGHYYGIGARFVAAMDKGGLFSNSAGGTGDVGRGTERLTNVAWCAYTAEVMESR